MIRRRLAFTGLVQNVFYRDFIAERAGALGLDGWVRNRADGSVEIVVEGASEMVETLISRAREGSPASRVREVVVTDDAPAEMLDGFEKRATV